MRWSIKELTDRCDENCSISKANLLATKIENFILDEHKEHKYSSDEINLGIAEASKRLAMFSLKANIKSNKGDL